jgi:hypothetical protein
MQETLKGDVQAVLILKMDAQGDWTWNVRGLIKSIDALGRLELIKSEIIEDYRSENG